MKNKFNFPQLGACAVAGAIGGTLIRVVPLRPPDPSWVSAAAAVVQAAGAIGAIWVSIGLARDSERRSIRAEEASAERERQAEAAAAARADAADRAAEERIKRAERRQESDLVVTVVTLAREALDVIDEQIAHETAAWGQSPNHLVFATQHNAHMAGLHQMIGDWKLQAKNAGLISAMSELERWTRPTGEISRPASEYVASWVKKRDRIAKAIAQIAVFGTELPELAQSPTSPHPSTESI